MDEAPGTLTQERRSHETAPAASCVAGSSEMDGQITVTVIVPVRDEPESLRRTLDSLLAQQFPLEQLEILVADGSTGGECARVVAAATAAGTAATTTAPTLRVENPGRSAPAGLNAALRVARGAVIIRVDAHAVVAPDFVAASVLALEESGADCVGGPLETIGVGWLGRVIAAATSSVFGVGGSAFRTGAASERDVDTVAFGAYRRDVFERIGHFDERFVRNQDDEFNLRLTRAGGRIRITPRIRVSYRGRDSLGALWQQYHGYGHYKPAVGRLHARLPSLRGLAPATLVAVLGVAAVVSTLAGDLWPLAAVGGAYAGAVALASLVTAARRGLRLFPGLLTVYPVLHVAYGTGFWRGVLSSPVRLSAHDRTVADFARRDANPATRERYAADDPVHALMLAERQAALDELLGRSSLPPDARVLDIACGRGDSLDSLPTRWRRHGVDLAPSRLAHTRGRLPGAALLRADGAALPFHDDAFDAVLLFTALSSVRAPEHRARIASEARRVVRPGGVILVYDFRRHPRPGGARGLPADEVLRLFPGAARETVRLTPIAPLLRWVGRVSLPAARALVRAGLFRTHFLVMIHVADDSRDDPGGD